MNLPNRVPVLANPQEGISTRNVSSAENTLSVKFKAIAKTEFSSAQHYRRTARWSWRSYFPAVRDFISIRDLNRCDDDVQSPRAMYAFDSGHFDIGSGGRP